MMRQLQLEQVPADLDDEDCDQRFGGAFGLIHSWRRCGSLDQIEASSAPTTRGGR
jgi:hypothetical protein